MGAVPETRHVDLCIIGSGSANSIPDERFDDWSVALVEGGTFGGTCLNVGCIPTKMYVHPADLARTPQHAGPLGVDLDPRPGPLGRRSATASSAGSTRSRRRASATGPRAATSRLFRQHGRFIGPTRSCGSTTAPRSPRTGS